MSADPERFAARRAELFEGVKLPHVLAVDDEHEMPGYVVGYCKCGAIFRSYGGGDDLRRKFEVHMFEVGLRKDMPA